MANTKHKFSNLKKCITEAQQFISALNRHFWQYAVMCRFSSQILIKMNKITTEIRYKDMSFDFIREVKGMKMYFNKDLSYAIIVNKDEEVLFELRADCGQNVGFLEDGLA